MCAFNSNTDSPSSTPTNVGQKKYLRRTLRNRHRFLERFESFFQPQFLHSQSLQSESSQSMPPCPVSSSACRASEYEEKCNNRSTNNTVVPESTNPQCGFDQWHTEYHSYGGHSSAIIGSKYLTGCA
jgi:hypothetical protein